MMSELKLGLLKLEVKSEVRLNIGQSYQQVQDQKSLPIKVLNLRPLDLTQKLQVDKLKHI